MKAEYKGKVDILCGIEWDQFSDDKRTGYDYWIGSVHYLHGANTGKYYEIDFRKQDLQACIDADFGGDGLAAAEAYFRAQESFLSVTGADREKLREEDVLEYYSNKASALIDNIDMLPNWCMYRATTRRLAELGADGIMTNLPHTLKAVYDDMYPQG